MFQSANAPMGLCSHAQTCNSKNAGKPYRLGAPTKFMRLPSSAGGLELQETVGQAIDFATTGTLVVHETRSRNSGQPLSHEPALRQPGNHDLRVMWNEPFWWCWISVVSALRHNELVARIRIHFDRDITISSAP